jgi:hypothetical protein
VGKIIDIVLLYQQKEAKHISKLKAVVAQNLFSK